ncbi:MAG: hypothetical protein CVV44_10795 [Spirochaetae bacterium HGW-Spirochaetae-1]|nr:MAG: hypothetical protein CVV44_10795 [Spirochaetae bacterium HGW-Spirochaetae-1]
MTVSRIIDKNISLFWFFRVTGITSKLKRETFSSLAKHCNQLNDFNCPCHARYRHETFSFIKPVLTMGISSQHQKTATLSQGCR